jgi:hypothetical protein
MLESTPVGSSDRPAEAEMEYRSIEPWAVGGLLLGLLSPAALLAPLLWLLPGLGILANCVALARLNRNSSRAGRGAALMGLGLSVMFALAPPVEMGTAYLLLRNQGREVADHFLEYLTHDQPEKALMLRTLPEIRQLEDPWTFFRYDGDAKKDLEKFTRMPLVRTLLALGDKADVKFLQLSGIGFSGPQAQVNYWYTVTFDDAGKKKTFVVGVVLERKPVGQPGLSPWRVKDVYGPVDPYKLD